MAVTVIEMYQGFEIEKYHVTCSSNDFSSDWQFADTLGFLSNIDMSN